MARFVIGFAGLIGSGKSTAAAELTRTGGFQRVRFAGPLKKMMAALGLSVDEIDGKLKEQPCALLCGKTPRHAMQTIGTEWGRNLIGEDLWIRAWKHAVGRLPAEVSVVADDVRFANEAAAIRDVGGAVVLIDRGLNDAGGSHPSEALDFDVDYVLRNTGSVADLHESLAAMVRGLLTSESADRIAPKLAA